MAEQSALDVAQAEMEACVLLLGVLRASVDLVPSATHCMDKSRIDDRMRLEEEEKDTPISWAAAVLRLRQVRAFAIQMLGEDWEVRGKCWGPRCTEGRKGKLAEVVRLECDRMLRRAEALAEQVPGLSGRSAERVIRMRRRATEAVRRGMLPAFALPSDTFSPASLVREALSAARAVSVVSVVVSPSAQEAEPKGTSKVDWSATLRDSYFGTCLLGDRGVELHLDPVRTLIAAAELVRLEEQGRCRTGPSSGEEERVGAEQDRLLRKGLFGLAARGVVVGSDAVPAVESPRCRVVV